MKQLSILIFLFVLAAGVNAQSNFLLYSYKGNVSVVENGVEAKAKIGKMLNGNATLKVAAGGAVTLICNEAAMFTISKAGSYPMTRFGDSCKVSGNSVSANYVKYVWASMTKDAGSAGSNRKAYMNTVGAVPRGDPMNNIWVDAKLDTVNYSGVSGPFPLSWKSYSEAEEFEFSLYTADNLSTPFFSTFVKKLKVPITDFVTKIKPGNTYYWTAAVKGETNETLKPFIYVTKETYAGVLANIKLMKNPGEAPAEEAYRTGFMLEDAHYLAEAFDYYSKAAQLDTTNMLYRSTLMSFKKDYEIK